MAGLIVMACSKTDPFIANGPVAIKKSAAADFVADTIYQPGGFSLYNTWTVIEGTVIEDVRHENIGEIEFLGGRDFRFFFRETAKTEIRPNITERYQRQGSSGSSSRHRFLFFQTALHSILLI